MLLGKQEDENRKKKLDNFSRWRNDDGRSDDAGGAGEKKQAKRQMLCLQFSLVLLLITDLFTLAFVAFFSLGRAFWGLDWLVNVSAVQTRHANKLVALDTRIC